MKQDKLWEMVFSEEMSYLTTKPKDYSWIVGATLMILFVIALAMSIN